MIYSHEISSGSKINYGKQMLHFNPHNVDNLIIHNKLFFPLKSRNEQEQNPYTIRGLIPIKQQIAAPVIRQNYWLLSLSDVAAKCVKQYTYWQI